MALSLLAEMFLGEVENICPSLTKKSILKGFHACCPFPVFTSPIRQRFQNLLTERRP